MIVYLAGAIDHVPPSFAVKWRQDATSRLEAIGYEVLDPTEGKDLYHPAVNTDLYTPKQIVESDKAMIDRADILLVEMSRKDIPYIGTSMEILYAWERGKQVYVWGGPQSYWVRYHATKVFLTLKETLDYLEGCEAPLRLNAILGNVRRLRASLYPAGWTADPLYRIEQDLASLLDDVRHG
jgi:nucleoside 2-deoxyribosyltransferase